MQRILEELEAEVYEINAEQQFLMLRLNDDLDIFYKKLEENNIQTVPELGNEYISSQIVPLIGDASYKVYPQSVLTRDNEEMLIRKHFLISQDEDLGVEPFKLSDLDDNVPLLLVNAADANSDPAAPASVAPLPADATAAAASSLGIESLQDTTNDAFNEGSLKLLQQLSEEKSALECLPTLPTLRPMSTPPLIPALTQSPSASLKREQQRSLLIPRGSSLLGEEQQQQQHQDQAVQTQQQLLLPMPLQPPPLAMAGGSRQRSPRHIDVAKSPLKHSSTSPPPLAPITKTPQPIHTDFEVVAQSRMNLRQALRRARKTKQQPRQFDEEDLELTSDKSPEQAAAAAMAASAAPGKGKPAAAAAGPTVAAAAPAAAGTAPASALPKGKGLPQAAGTISKQYKTRNAYGAGRKPATPPLPPSVAAASQQPAAPSGSSAATAGGASSGSSGSSDDSHQELEFEQQRLCASAAQWRDEPRETRVLPSEYGQEHFLGLFRLYTHDTVKKLCQRHSKRKRRTVQNASGVVFHYGQQLAAIDAVRQKKLKADKPEFLLSPKDKRLQAKKAHKAATAVGSTAQTSNRKSKSKTPEKLEDPLAGAVVGGGQQKCKECKKRGRYRSEVYRSESIYIV